MPAAGWLAVASAAACWSAAAGPTKRAPTPPGTLRLEAACRGCFPEGADSCERAQYRSCCAQEIGCHDFHCRELVMGRLRKGEKVRVRSDFQSDDESPSEVSKGMTGRVIRIDQDGDAFIKFWEDEYDDDFRRYWVHRPTFWEHLEVPGRMAELRAAKVVSCMNNCTLVQECRMMQMSKKEQKAFQKCMKGCKMEECKEEKECSIMIEAYSTCKGRTAESGECNPEPRKGKGSGAEL